MKRIEFNKKRAVKICNTLIDAYDKKEGVFARKDIYPETKPWDMPRKDYPEFLFYSNILNYSTNAKNLFNSLKKGGLELKTGSILSKSNEEIAKLIKSRFSKTAADRLKKAAETLDERYDGNPLNLFNGNLQKTYERIEEIPGYGIKLARLLTIWYHKYGFLRCKENDLELPVDLHVTRISINTGIIIISENHNIRKDRIVNPLTEFYATLCKKHGFSGLKLNEAFWGLGAKACSKAIIRKDDYLCKTECPVEKFCKKEMYTPKKLQEKYIDGKREKNRADGNTLVRTGRLRAEQEVLKF